MDFLIDRYAGNLTEIQRSAIALVISGSILAALWHWQDWILGRERAEPELADVHGHLVQSFREDISKWEHERTV
jgi:hypothetical protein